MVRYKCIGCRYVYDPKVGDPTAGVPPGVEFEALPDDGVCPECMVGKGQFVMVEG
ncbi:MAG TPA: rubredoxin [Methanoregulaceae archaeon]|nr:rubredoxin [Methanoregulaceae archaeon]